MTSSTARRALTVLLPAVVASFGIQAQEKPAALGLCPVATGRLDAYMQALCDGETALRADRTAEALDRFRLAASLSRMDATNELAWAGLAAAHCRARDFDSATHWASHFTQARRLWLGELDCDAPEDDTRGRLSPFVRSRMCSERLVADYALLRQNPSAPYAGDLKVRLQQVADGLAHSCATLTASRADSAAKPARKAVDSKAKAKKKRGKRAAARSGTGKAKAN